MGGNFLRDNEQGIIFQQHEKILEQNLMHPFVFLAGHQHVAFFQNMLHRILKETLAKSACLLGSFTCPWLLCNGIYCALMSSWFDPLRPRQNSRLFPDDIFKDIFLNENVGISLEISLNFVPQGPINNNPALVQIMVWCRPGDNDGLTYGYMRHSALMSLNRYRYDGCRKFTFKHLIWVAPNHKT